MKLEFGKKYVLRNGDIVGPLEHVDENCDGPYRFTCDICCEFWTTEGFSHSDKTFSEYDIVSEYNELEQQEDKVMNKTPLVRPGVHAGQHELSNSAVLHIPHTWANGTISLCFSGTCDPETDAWEMGKQDVAELIDVLQQIHDAM